jgi:hypothetical protein
MSEQPETPGERKALNAKTESGPEPGPERDVVFHYSRERRLARAPQAVRDLYDTSPASRPTLYKALTGGTRSGAMLLITIIVVSFVLMILSRGLRESGGVKFAGNTLTVSAMSFPGEGAAYLAAVKKADSERAYTGPVDVAVSIYQKDAGEDMPIETRRIFFTVEPEEDFRFSVPFTGPELVLVFRAEEETAALRVKPE